MTESVVIKINPKVEFQFHDIGFMLIDEQTAENSGLYSYTDVQSVELNKVWFPRLANWLRIVTWVLNGVPYFPDAETCKKAKLIIHCKKKNLGIWLPDTYMAGKAKQLNELLEEKTKLSKAAL